MTSSAPTRSGDFQLTISAAYLHPTAQAGQVGHILRAYANAVLRRYPPAPSGSSRVAQLTSTLDRLLRQMTAAGGTS